MASNVKNAILQKQIEGQLYQLMVKTTSDMVYVADDKTLTARLEELNTLLTNHGTSLATMLGDQQAYNILAKINELIGNEKKTDVEGTLGKAIDDLKKAVGDTTGATDGILKTAKDYTNTQIGAIGEGKTVKGYVDEKVKTVDDKFGFTAADGENVTVKSYVDGVKEALNTSIAGAFHFMGSVDYKAQLPADAKEGDVYQVKFEGTEDAPGKEVNAEYARTGSSEAGKEWEVLGLTIDMSVYATNERLDSTAQTLEGKITTAKTEASEALANEKKADVEGTLANETKKVADALATEKDDTKAETLAGKIKALNTAVDGRGRVLYDANKPADLSDNDLWVQILN